jgi:N-acetylglutamate synthase-like GNAT family acetyltransferase
MIRKATPSDIPAIVELAIESVSINPIPVKNDTKAMRETAERCLQPAHFLMVSEIDGEVVGAVAAFVQPSFWYTKLQCSVLLHYSRKPGEWAKLMRELSRWVKSRSGIKVAIVELEPESDPRMIEFMRRIGFDRVSTNTCYVRGESCQKP